MLLKINGGCGFHIGHYGTTYMQAAQRRGSTEELSVLIAQYSMVVRRQAALRDVFQVRTLPVE